MSNIRIYAESGKLIHIARRGENLATTIIFNVEALVTALGENRNAFSLLVLQNEKLSTIGNLLYNLDSKELSWTVNDSYTLKKGKGKCQVVYKIDEKVSKSEIYDIIVTEGV